MHSSGLPDLKPIFSSPSQPWGRSALKSVNERGSAWAVTVRQSMVDDDTTYILCKDIAEKIEKNLTYPGQIRVTVIRERRAVGLAK